MFETLQKGEERLREAFVQAVTFHVGHIHTIGWTYKLLDPEFYVRGENGQPISTLTVFQENFSYAAMARFTMRAAASFVLVPLPHGYGDDSGSLGLSPESSSGTRSIT